MKTKLIALLVIVLSLTSCTNKQCPQCEPVVKYMKPSIPKITEAKIEQCRFDSILDNTKCVLLNYFEMKAERDKLRIAIDEMID